MNKINLKQKLQLFNDYWNPRVVGELNGQHVRLAKLKGEFLWHHHEHEDELFLILKGRLTIKLRSGDIVLDESDCFIVPRGVEHKPVAAEETHVLVFAPAGTLNTGNLRNERTHTQLERI